MTDLKIYGAVLKLLRHGAEVNVQLIADVGDIPVSTVYHKIRNYYLIENQIKRRENGKRKSN
jgi:hypothetical protein